MENSMPAASAVTVLFQFMRTSMAGSPIRVQTSIPRYLRISASANSRVPLHEEATTPLVAWVCAECAVALEGCDPGALPAHDRGRGDVGRDRRLGCLPDRATRARRRCLPGVPVGLPARPTRGARACPHDPYSAAVAAVGVGE